LPTATKQEGRVVSVKRGRASQLADQYRGSRGEEMNGAPRGLDLRRLL